MFPVQPDLSMMLRIKSIIDSLQPPPQLAQANSDPQGVVNSTPSVSPGAMPPHTMNDLFTPKNTIGNAYENSLSNMPARQDPGVMRKIGAALIGIGTGIRPVGMWGGNPVGMETDVPAAMKASQSFLDEPNNQRMSDWANKTKMLGAGALEEDKDNQLSEMAARNQILGEQAIKKQDEVERENAAKDKAAQDKIVIANQRAQTYQQNANTNAGRASVYAEMAKGGIPQWDQSGNLYIAYKDATMKPVTNPDGTPITAKMFSPQELQEMKDHAALQRTNITVAGANERAAETQQNKGWTVYTNPDTHLMYRVNVDSGQVIPVNVPGGGQLAKPGIAQEGSVSTVETKTPNGWFKHYILGEGAETVTKSTTTTKTPTTGSTTTKTAPMEKQITLPSGKTGIAQSTDGGKTWTLKGGGD